QPRRNPGSGRGIALQRTGSRSRFRKAGQPVTCIAGRLCFLRHSAAKPGQAPISLSGCLTESTRGELSGIDGQLIRARKRELTSQTPLQKKIKKSLAMPKTTDKTVPPEELGNSNS